MNNVIENVRRADYIDKDGIKRRVLIPEGIADYSEGIPVSLSVDQLYAHCSIDFRRTLIEELWARGLVEPADYLKAGAAELITAALRSVVKHDTLDILALAKEENRK